MKRFVLLFSIFAALLIACSVQKDSASEVEKVMTEYKTWARLTPEPRNISPHLWGLCRLPTPEEQAFLESQHADRYLNIYANNIGAEIAKHEGERVFPVGSVIVKEKLLTLEGNSAEAVAMMIKRGKGFNPAGDDWEYIYWEKNGKLTRGPQQLANCQACHLNTRETDSVFWPEGLKP
ncbi:MAG: cytochrome P460 family protein [bacterium]